MATVRVELAGLNAYIREVDQEVDRIADGMLNAVDATGNEVISESRMNAPKGETGVLSRSHQWNMDAGFNKVGNMIGIGGRALVAALYGAAQNFGIPGRPTGGAVPSPMAIGMGPVNISPALSPAIGNIQHVSAHTRLITQAWGRQLKSPMTVNVRAHTRRMNLPGTFFFTNALNDAEPRFNRRLQEVVDG